MAMENDLELTCNSTIFDFVGLAKMKSFKNRIDS